VVTIEFQQVEAETVRPLRTEVLRPEWEESRALVFEADRDETTYHFALSDVAQAPRSGSSPTETTKVGRTVAVLTWLEARPPEEVLQAAGVVQSEEGAETLAYRLRGMAVEEGQRRAGLGRRLLAGSMSRLSLFQPSCRVVWCYARESAVAFYEAEGFEAVGDSFEIEGIGTHRVMWRVSPQALAEDGTGSELAVS
jgi:predicted GNAT family N-acyltransferase